MPPENRPARFCSRESLAAQEPLFGTASRIDVWFLLQYAQPWAADAFAGSALPAAVKQRLRGLLHAQPGWRLLFIKREPRAAGPLRLYVAVADELAPRLTRFDLHSYEDLLQLDLATVVAGDPAYAAQASDEAVFLVCTHGVHDRCCAKFGLPVYRALAQHAPAATWQSSHVGGDRFAANVLCFPHGLYYGHVDPAEAPTIADAYRAGQVVLDRYRGRSCLGFIPQAAEYYLRRATGVRALPGFQCRGVRRIGSDRWAVRFTTLPAGGQYQVHLAREPLATPLYINCRATAAAAIDHYRLLAVEEVAPQ